MNITIEHIRISLGAKFQLTLANFFFFFWANFRKKGISGRKRKKALVRTSMVVTYYIKLFITYYIKLFRTGADKHNVILMTLLLLVAETKSWNSKFKLERGI